MVQKISKFRWAGLWAVLTLMTWPLAAQDAPPAPAPVETLSDPVVIDLGLLLGDTEGWKKPGANGVMDIVKDKSISFSGPYAIGGYTAKKYLNATFRFRINSTLEGIGPRGNPGWPYIAVRCTKPLEQLWNQDGVFNDCYYVVFKKRTIDLESRKNGNVAFSFKFPNKGLIVAEELSPIIEFGAVDVENGVKLTLTVGDKQIFSFIDKKRQVPDAGYLGIGAVDGPLTVLAP